MIALKTRKPALAAVFAVISVILTTAFFRYTDTSVFSEPVLFFCFAAVCAVLLYTILKESNVRVHAYSAVFSGLLSLSFIIGDNISMFATPHFPSLTAGHAVYFILIWSMLYILSVPIAGCITKWRFEPGIRTAGKRYFFYCFFIFTLLWMPYLLANFPVAMSSDSFGSTCQALGINALNNHCPLAFTLFVTVTMKIGMLFGTGTAGAFAFSLAQMTVMSLILSYCVYWLYRRKAPKAAVICALAFFALDPVIAMYSFTMWKDIMFAGFMLLLMLCVYDTVDGGRLESVTWKRAVTLGLIFALVCFSRSNGVYIALVMMVILAIYLKRSFKKIVPVFLAVAVFYTVVTGPIYNAIGIPKVNFAESVGIPLQQIAYTAANSGELSVSDTEYIESLCTTETMINEYNPISPDYIKFNQSFNNEFLNGDKIKFISVWLSIGLKNPGAYVKAWLLQTVGYYHIGTTNWICQYGIYDDPANIQNTDGYIRSDDVIKSVSGMDARAMVQGAVKLLQKFPVVSLLFSIGAQMWLCFFYAVLMLIRKKYRYILVVLPLLLMWGTIMIAVPTFCEFRYMYSLHLALPLLITTAFTAGKDKKALPESPEHQKEKEGTIAL